MPTLRNRHHILVSTQPNVEAYTPHARIIPPSNTPVPADRVAHGTRLKLALDQAGIEGARRREEASIEVHGAAPGIYLQFESRPGLPLVMSSLEDARQGIEVVAVTYAQSAEGEPRPLERATVFIPDGKLKHFVSRFEAYSRLEPKVKGERRYESMIDPIATVRLATLRALWTDSEDSYPGEDEVIWWEVWLRRRNGTELERLMELAGTLGLPVGDRRLQFDDRIVTLIRATPRQLAVSLDVLDDLAEVRLAKETAAIFHDMTADEQAEWTKELQERTQGPNGDSPAVCLLDTGVNHGHPLITPALSAADCLTCDPTWGNHDHHGHGTEMAGLALYGDLTPVLTGREPVHLRHCLESVKILPPNGQNKPELYGALTADAVSRAEIQATQRRRCFSMSVTTIDTRDRGQPTSWSSAVDALAAGRAFDPSSQGLIYLDDASERDFLRRLFIISAGNVGALDALHLDRSDTEPVHDPAHAWNALTVGAYTEKTTLRDASLRGWNPVAAAGDLSPWSTTSVVFADSWPIKPDVVFEGGNVASDGAGQIYPVPDLSLLSTFYKPAQGSFVTTYATSAATAQCARMAGRISAEYPQLWPESVRGLIVHSAEWTRTMKAHLKGAGGKSARARLVRRYGFGVPDLSRALRSANDALTLIAQDIIHPFSNGKMREMHLYELPWPKEVLEELGETSVRLKITLSYFVEPNPSRRGWQRQHRYASHGLRFEVKDATESLADFRKRLNKAALDEDEKKPSANAGSSNWYLGERARNRGSIHCDIWVGMAADLAERGVVGIYPVSGWWKDQPARDRSNVGARYSLMLSIETEAANVDIWTPVAIQVGIPVETAVLV